MEIVHFAWNPCWPKIWQWYSQDDFNSLCITSVLGAANGVLTLDPIRASRKPLLQVHVDFLDYDGVSYWDCQTRIMIIIMKPNCFWCIPHHGSNQLCFIPYWSALSHPCHRNYRLHSGCWWSLAVRTNPISWKYILIISPKIWKRKIMKNLRKLKLSKRFMGIIL